MRNLITFSVGTFLGITLLVSLLLIQEGIPTASSKWAYDLYRVKEQHASQSSSSKLLVVAGSNSLFGIHTQQLERKFGLPVTNFGVHAGLGLGYILERSKRSLKAGDLAYLPLEYALYQQDPEPSAQLMDFLLARDPDHFHSFGVLQQIQGYVNVPFPRIIEGLMGGSDEYLGSSAKTYNVSNIDEAGNQIKNSPELALKYVEKLSKLGPKNFGNGEITDYSRKLLLDYFDWARNNDVCLIAAPPNLMYHDEYTSDKFLYFSKEIDQFYSNSNIQFVGSPQEYLFPKHLFFDTEYHLNSTGVARRTELTLRDLGNDLAALCSWRSG